MARPPGNADAFSPMSLDQEGNVAMRDTSLSPQKASRVSHARKDSNASVASSLDLPQSLSPNASANLTPALLASIKPPAPRSSNGVNSQHSTNKRRSRSNAEDDAGANSRHVSRRRRTDAHNNANDDDDDIVITGSGSSAPYFSSSTNGHRNNTELEGKENSENIENSSNFDVEMSVEEGSSAASGGGSKKKGSSAASGGGSKKKGGSPPKGDDSSDDGDDIVFVKAKKGVPLYQFT